VSLTLKASLTLEGEIYCEVKLEYFWVNKSGRSRLRSTTKLPGRSGKSVIDVAPVPCWTLLRWPAHVPGQSRRDQPRINTDKHE
jgi:hypothetical protein